MDRTKSQEGPAVANQMHSVSKKLGGFGGVLKNALKKFFSVSKTQKFSDHSHQTLEQ